MPPGFTRKPPKYERFIRPTGLRMSKAHVTHPELKATFQLEIIGVKKNPNGQAYTGLGVVTTGGWATGGFGGVGGICHGLAGGGLSPPPRSVTQTRELLPAPPHSILTSSASAQCRAAGTIIEVNVSELGLVTPGGKVVWGKYAQGAVRC